MRFPRGSGLLIGALIPFAIYVILSSRPSNGKSVVPIPPEKVLSVADLVKRFRDSNEPESIVVRLQAKSYRVRDGGIEFLSGYPLASPLVVIECHEREVADNSKPLIVRGVCQKRVDGKYRGKGINWFLAVTDCRVEASADRSGSE
jgi:hypothetical protein